MKIEHFALNVAQPTEMAAWYNKNLGLKIVRKIDKAPYTHFLADDSGNVLLEIYNNPPENVPMYSEMNSLQLHLAFVSQDPHADRILLEKEGAVFQEEVKLEDGSLLVMMRDPWGLAIQLCRRGENMLKDY
jgi:glyoxylase I family protein